MSQLPEDIAEQLAQLDERNRGYGNKPLPDPLDEQIARLVERIVEGPDELHEAVREDLSPMQAQFLLGYGERMASFAVRMSSPSLLENGLLAIGLAAEKLYFKDVVLVLTLYERSAELLGVDPVGLFERAAARVGAPQYIFDFPKREPANRDLSSMGYEEQETSDGFLYVRNW
jgi:hypothetical protein